VVNAITSLHYSLGYVSFMFVFMKWADVGYLTFLLNLQKYVFKKI